MLGQIRPWTKLIGKLMFSWVLGQFLICFYDLVRGSELIFPKNILYIGTYDFCLIPPWTIGPKYVFYRFCLYFWFLMGFCYILYMFFGPRSGLSLVLGE